MPILSPYEMWPDVERTVVAWLNDRLIDAKVLTETPVDLEDVLLQQDPDTGTPYYSGVVQVLKVPGGGASDRINEESLVDIYCYTIGRAAMWLLARRTHAAMLTLDSHAAAGAYIDTVDCFAAPGEIVYGNPNVRRTVASYQLTTMPQAIA